MTGAREALLPFLALLACAPASAPASAQEPTFTFEELGPGVFAAVVVPNPPSYAFAGSLVVVGDDGVLVVDTQQSTTAARALIAEVRARTELPVRWVVNTHWHGDHVYGNQAYREAYPGVVFVGHDRTREGVLTRGREALARELETLPGTIADRSRWLETGVGPGGDPLTDAQREAVRRSHRLRTEYLAMLGELELIPPDVTVDGVLTLHLGGRSVRIHPVGPAHTEGDVVVEVVGTGIVAVGDLLEEGTPYIDDADLAGWARALEYVAGLEPTVVVPAHGSVQRSGGLLAWQTAFFAAAAEAANAVAAGEDPEVAASRLAGFGGDFASVGVDGERFAAFVRRVIGRE